MTNVGKLIEVEISEKGLAVVTLNRPSSLNSLSLSMIEDLAGIFKSVGQNAKVKVIILTGAGRAFCSGVDLKAAQSVFKSEFKDIEKDPIEMMGRCRQPIIGAVNGFAITGGFELALACDILIASTNAKFMDTHAKFGIFPSWGLSQKLSRLIGINCARHVSLSAMPVDAKTAQSWGLVSQVVPPGDLMTTATLVADAIINNNEKMVLEYKAVINDGEKLPLGEALLLEKDRARASYKSMTPEDFKKMLEFIALRGQKQQRSSKL